MNPTTEHMMEALTLIQEFSLHHPTLPAPYITLHTSSTGTTALGIQLQYADEFEMWREALNLDATDVRLAGTITIRPWLDLRKENYLPGVDVNLTGHGLFIP